MKAAVTGHSGGLGKAIAERLARDGHEIVGFSLDNGYDLSTQDGFRKIVAEALACDLFVNCAHDRMYQGIGQTSILIKLFHHWQNEPKHIISIGSNAPDYFTSGAPVATKYRAAKVALDAASLDLTVRAKRCRVSLVRPGWLNSLAATAREQAAAVKLDKLEYDEVADIVAMIVNLAPKITISSITLGRTPSEESFRKRRVPESLKRLKRWWRRRS